MAEVFRARLPGVAGFEKIVVIKRLHPHFSTDPGMVQMFVDEAKLAANVQHKNVVQVYELDRVESGDLYIVMEYVAGIDLKKLLRHAERANVRIPPWFSTYVMIEVLDALVHAYDLLDSRGRRRNIVHRDVSPENIFISNLGDVKLGDFGVARDDTRPEPFAREAKGKLGYMAPEQLAGERLDQRCDVFSAGVTLWECLTQRRLFRGESAAETMHMLINAARTPPSRIMPDVLEAFDPIVLWTLQADRNKRTPSARALQEQLLETLARMRKTAGPVDVRGTLRELLATKPPDEEVTVAMVTDELIVSEKRIAAAAAAAKEEVIDLDPHQIVDEAMADAWEMEVSDPRTDPSPPPIAPVAAPSIASLPIPEPRAASMPRTVDIRPPAAAIAAAAKAQDSPPEDDPSWDGTYAIINPRLKASKSASVATAPTMNRAAPLIETDDLVRRRLVYEIPIAAKPSQVETGDIVKGLLESVRIEEPDSWPIDQVPLTPTSANRVWAPYSGPHPFWLRMKRRDGHTEDPFGPCSFADVGTMIRSTFSAAAKRTLEVSADGRRFISLLRFLDLSEHDVFEEELPSSGVLTGKLGKSSLIGLLGQIAEHCPTGKLTLIRGPNTLGQQARAEIHVSQGAPLHVASDLPSLETPELLVACRILEADAVAECMHVVLAEERPLAAVVLARARVDLLERRPKMMMARLENLIGWTDARYIFSPSQPRTCAPFAKSLYSVVFELAQRTKSPDTMRAELMPHLGLRFERTDRFDRVVHALELPKNEIDGLGPFGYTRTLDEAVRTSTAGDRFGWVAAYVLLELGLILPKARILS
jgi:serine/threonine protein kinase